MNLIALVVTMCMLGKPTECRDFTYTYDGDYAMLTPYKCALRAQEVLPQIMEGKPNWSLQKYKCVRPKDDGLKS